MSFPAWLEPLPDAQLMRATDAWAIEQRGVPSLQLMERAGEGLARVVAELAPSGRVAVVCGKGNNGGDGLVAARLLRQAGRDVDVLCLWPPSELSRDAREMAQRLPGDPPGAYDAARLERASGAVDALLGTGFGGAPRAPLDDAIAGLNALQGPVIAADVPSGVDASTGEVAGAAVRAAATVTFHRAKPGLWIHPGKSRSGRVHVVDIGIPAEAPGEATAGLIGSGALAGLPRRGPLSTKFTSGAVHVIGGSRGLTGAPAMAALGAMRAGAGYVTIAAPRAVELAFTTRLLESMYVGLPDEDGALVAEAVGPALEAAGRARAIVLGPGLSRRPGAQAFGIELAARVEAPLVVDADGLNALAEDFPGPLPRRTAPTVITPHAGELGRLLGVSSDEVGARRLHHARAAAARANAIVVLKGDDTLVADAGGLVGISPGDAPALATAGTGDVLSGVIAALLARGVPPLQAACAGVLGHNRAGRLAAADHGPDGVIASDVIAALPAALNAG